MVIQLLLAGWYIYTPVGLHVIRTGAFAPLPPPPGPLSLSSPNLVYSWLPPRPHLLILLIVWAMTSTFHQSFASKLWPGRYCTFGNKAILRLFRHMAVATSVNDGKYYTRFRKDGGGSDKQSPGENGDESISPPGS